MEVVAITGAVLLLIALVRLAMTDRDNIQLYRALRNAYENLADSKQSVDSYAARLEALNQELEVVQAELIRSHRELVRSSALWERLAVTDTVTALANRRAFQDRLREEIARAHRYRYPFLLLMVDVDNFKSYNDTFGHPAGDQVLRDVATVMRETVREGDLVARYGGEEFAVLLPQTDTAAGRLVTERLRAAVERHTFLNRGVTVSTGVAQFEADGDDAETLIAWADRALYAAKWAGKNRVMFASDVRPG